LRRRRASFSAGGAVELKHRHDLAQASGRDARAVKRAHIALLDALQDARQSVESFFSSSDLVTGWRMYRRAADLINS